MEIKFGDAVKLGVGFSLGSAIVSLPIVLVTIIAGATVGGTVPCPACGEEIPVGPPYPATVACLTCRQLVEVSGAEVKA